MLGRGLAAIILSTVVPLPGAAAEVLKPYHAVYAISLDASPAGSGIAAYEGGRDIRLTLTCDGARLDQSEWQRITAASGDVVARKTRSEVTESADGRVVTARTVSAPDLSGTIWIEVRFDEAGRGVVTYRKGAAADLVLPAGTLLPIALLRRGQEAMQAGEAGFSAPVYLGWESEPSSVQVVIGPWQQEPVPGSLLPGRWRDVTAEYTVSTVGSGPVTVTRRGRVGESGVSDHVVSNDGTFTLTDTLQRVEWLPMPDCD